MPASQQRTPPRNARLATAAVAAALLIALGVIGKRLLLDRAAPRDAIERNDGGARDAGATKPDELPQPVAARKQDDAASEEVAATNDSTARPTGEVRGTVRRQRDGSVVTEGVVAFSFVVLDNGVLNHVDFAALDEEQRAFVSEFDEAPIAADGSFRCRIPAPAVVLRATIRPKLGANRGPQFLETERELGELALAVDTTVDLPLVVDEGGSIEGVVVTAQGGFPISGARVSIPWWSDSNDDWSCTTDADGRFRVSGIRREVAEARSNSEAVVTCAGYVPRRFLVPPADDGLDVKGLRLEMERGVAVAVIVVPPKGLDAAERRAWDAALERARALLLPMPSDDAGVILVSPWLRESAAERQHDEGIRFDFEPIAPTRDAVAVVRLASGKLLARIAIDAAIERAPWRVIAHLPADANEAPLIPMTAEATEAPYVPLADKVRIEVRAPDGSLMAEAPISERLVFGEDDFNLVTRSNVNGRLPVARPDGHSLVELRVAGYESVWLALNPDVPPDAATFDALATPRLVITFRPLARAR